jgi:hypothetical protein
VRAPQRRRPHGHHDQRPGFRVAEGEPLEEKQVRRGDPQRPGQQRGAVARQPRDQRIARRQSEHRDQDRRHAPGIDRIALGIE